MADPVVGDLRILGLEEDVLDPVRQLPAGRRAGTAGTDAERVAAVGDDLVGQGHELVPGLGDLVALGLECLDGVPDDRLDVDLGRDAQMWSPSLVRPSRREVGLELRGIHERRNVDDLAVGSPYASTAEGCASIARSGGAPPSMRVLSTVSWLEAMLSTWTIDAGRRLEIGDGGEAGALAAGPLRLDGDLLAH